ncbi:MAG: hypothetical protein E7047_05580 [Lentisphaerae bacterium]|nr:hypothetical protein [Lentisphaerota bacterium]
MAIEVSNAGFPGDTTLELLKKFQRDVAAREPDLVVLLIGSNDMLYPGHMLTIGEYCKNLNTLLDRTAVIGADVILMTAPHFITALLLENYPQTIEHALSPETRLVLLNDAIKAIAAERQLELVDLYELIAPVDMSPESMILNPANSDRRDGMHFTAAGNRAVALAVYEKIRKYFSEKRRIICWGDSLTYGVYMPGKGTADPAALTYPGILCKLLNS